MYLVFLLLVILLLVVGDARITGILTIGTGSITLDGSNNQLKVGTGVTITTNGIVGITSINDGPLAGTRNLIINGGMDIWQRGTSQTTSGSYGADRFWMANAASATRSTDAPDGFTYSTKLTYSASDMALGQPIELPATGEQGQLVAGTTLTLSYYAKVSSGTEGIVTSINFRDDKFSGSNQVSFTSSNPNATWTTNWARYQHQFTIPTVAGTNVLAGLEIAGIGKDAFITGVQLEPGSVATPFERRPIGTELALCQRYYQVSATAFAGRSSVAGANFVESASSFKVDMRTAPTCTINNFSGDAGASSSPGLVDITSTGAVMRPTITGSNQFYRSGYTASAEL